MREELPAEAFLEAIEDARLCAARDHGIELRWIFDIPADFGLPAAEATAAIACDHDVPGFVASFLDPPGKAWLIAEIDAYTDSPTLGCCFLIARDRAPARR